MIGVGVCINIELQLRTITPGSVLFVAQDFGCVFHEHGDPMATVHSKEETILIAKDFLQ